MHYIKVQSPGLTLLSSRHSKHLHLIYFDRKNGGRR